MGSIITYDCNAGMERVFLAKAGGTSRNIANDKNYDVYFEITDSELPSETRRLDIFRRSTTLKVLTVPLNNNGGQKPLAGLTSAYQPTVKPNIKPGILSDVELERVFYAEIDLCATGTFTVTFQIVPNIGMDDFVRYLSFNGAGSGLLDGKIIILNAAGGKKPLGAGVGIAQYDFFI